ncbi:hypothetical protein K7432_006889 [Basidiobolus ranarum]|uniref:GATA-type domain-containing protein n=1 Tax=Basidiobolus ranarum TaxID=34480 RepID=A0ABR2W0X9_9FUNG
MESDTEKKILSASLLKEGSKRSLTDEDLKTDTKALLSCLIHTRKAYTSLFRKYGGGLESGVQYLYIGTCTLFIGPHTFPGTKFYRVLHPVLEHFSEEMVHLTEKSLDISELSINTLSDVPETLTPGELIFEFMEDPSESWLFPEEAIVEATNISEPFEIIATFSSNIREQRTPSSMDELPSMMMHMSRVSKELWLSIKQVTKDVSFVYRYMTDKVKYLPNRLYVKYSLPCELPEALVKKTIAPTTVTVAEAKDFSIIKTPSKSIERRASDSNSESRRNSKKSKSLGSSEVKKPKPTAVVSRKNSNSYNSTNGNGKKCAYCSCKSTPMWRRGPAGAGTLCNACGVKWKHGKILQDVAVSSDDIKSAKVGRPSSPVAFGSSLPTTPLPKLKSKAKSKSSHAISPDSNVDADTSDKEDLEYKSHPSPSATLKTPNRSLATPLKKRKFTLSVPNHSFTERYHDSSKSI